MRRRKERKRKERKNERKKDIASKKEPALLLHNLMICIYIHCIKERKKERKFNDIYIYIASKKERKKEEKERKKTACAPSEDSDQPGHPPSLIRVFAVRMKKAWVLTYPLSAHQRL